MLAFESMRVEDRHAFVPSFPPVLAHKDINTFGAFLNEFTGGSWVPHPEGTGDWRSTASTLPDGDDKCQSSGDSVVLGRGRSLLRHIQTADRVPSDKQIATVEKGFQRRENQNGIEQQSEWTETNRGNEADGFTAHDNESSRLRHSRLCQSTDSVFVPDEPNGSSFAGGQPTPFPVPRTLAHASFRMLTNATYLRRMHLSKEDAVGLFPKMRQTIEHVFSTDMKRRASLASLKICTTVVIRDDKGRRWPIVVECLRTAGQRHVRINKGWAAMCSANSLSVGKCLRFKRWEEVSQAGTEEVVTVTVM